MSLLPPEGIRNHAFVKSIKFFKQVEMVPVKDRFILPAAFLIVPIAVVNNDTHNPFGIQVILAHQSGQNWFLATLFRYFLLHRII